MILTSTFTLSLFFSIKDLYISVMDLIIYTTFESAC